MSLNYRTFVVANPRAGAGQVAQEWPRLERLLRVRLPQMDFAFTEGPGHATLLAREALRQGWEMVVGVGGDGTINEIVNGFFEPTDAAQTFALDGEGWMVARQPSELLPIAAEAVLGLIPMGTGGDFRRTVGLMGGAREAIEHLSGRDFRPIDVGQVAYVDNHGALASRLFLNIASAGISGRVDDLVNSSWKGLGGPVSFFAACARAIATWHNLDLELRLDDMEEFRQKTLNLVVANGEYFGGGMWVAPGAEIDDGEFQVVVLGDISRLQSVAVFQKIFSGRHLRDRKVYRKRARQVRARLLDPGQTGLLDLDGEQPGRLPALWQVLTKALRLKI